jgi:RNA polymerase sigma factor (sigma-70 family)
MGMKLPPFQFLLEAYREPIYRFLVAIVGRDDAEDCFQETFLAALAAYPRLRNASNLKAWLFKIAHNKAIDRHRVRSRETPATFERVSSRDGHKEVWFEVERLPAKQRAAVFHRYASGLSYKEIALVMSTTDTAARRNVHEGLKKLKEVLAK